MNPYQRFFLVVAMIGGLIYYVAGVVLMTPPLHAVLFAKEEGVVATSYLEARTIKPSALPAIDVRANDGEVVWLSGYHWMETDEANEIIAAYSVGDTVEVVRYKNQLWPGLSGVRDMILLFVSGFGAFLALFGLWMVWKVRKAE